MNFWQIVKRRAHKHQQKKKNIQKIEWQRQLEIKRTTINVETMRSYATDNNSLEYTIFNFLCYGWTLGEAANEWSIVRQDGNAACFLEILMYTHNCMYIHRYSIKKCNIW